jgi:hypothetical protein
MEGVMVRFAAATFRPHLGTEFRVRSVDGGIPLRLAEVIALSGGQFERFSLIFHGPPAPLLPQGMYAFHHDVLAEMELFIVPVVGSNAERILYEACFNVAAETSPAP